MIGAVLAVLSCAAPAAATEGSVPAEVVDFASAPDGLIAGLRDFLGPGPEGGGIDFDDTTTMGDIDRVFSFTPGWLADADAEPPVILANEWAIPVTVGDDPVGVAVVWINPSTVRPQLADFVANARFASALPDVSDTSYLVHDSERSAWLAVSAPGLTVLVPGTAGITGETRLPIYWAAIAASQAAQPDEQVGLGSALSVGVIVAVALIVILVLLVPAAWRRRRERTAPELEGDDET